MSEEYKPVVLLVDDEPVITRIYSAKLKDNRWTTQSFYRAMEALEYYVARKGDIMCVITDYKMPGMNGVEFLKAIRANQNGRRVPVLLNSGTLFPDVVEAAQSAGVDKLLQKPPCFDDISIFVENAFRDMGVKG